MWAAAEVGAEFARCLGRVEVAVACAAFVVTAALLARRSSKKQGAAGTFRCGAACCSVKGLVLAIVSTYKGLMRLWMWCRGDTAESVSERRIVTGQAWEEFCDSLKAAGAIMFAPGCPSDPFNQAEGIRYLSRLTRVALENFVECADPCAPQLVALANGSRSAPIHIGSDNPDNLYQSATVSSAYTYRLYGNIGTVHYLGFGVQAGSYGKQGGLRTVDYREVQDMHVDADGNVEIYICAADQAASLDAPDGANFLTMVEEPREHVVIVRQTFMDRLSEVPAQLRIERVGLPNLPRSITPAALDAALDTCGLFVGGASAMFAVWARGFQAHTNQLPLFDQERSNRAGGDPNIRYYHSYWKLEPDEALVIDAVPPGCATWNFQLNNHWMESLDYRFFTVHVNKHTARYRADGSVRVVVAHSDPNADAVGADASNVMNWINTCDHLCGTMCWRWIKPEIDHPPPSPLPRVVKFADLADLPFQYE